MAKRNDGDTSFFREAVEAGDGYISGKGFQPALDVIAEDLSALAGQYHLEDLPILAACMNTVAVCMMNVARERIGPVADTVYRVAHEGMEVMAVPQVLEDAAAAAGEEVGG